MSLATKGDTATLTVSTQADANEWVPELLAIKESRVWVITGDPPNSLPTPPESPWQAYPDKPITRRVLVVDGATEEISLLDCGAIDEVCYDASVDAVIVRNCPPDIADDLEVECGHAEIEFTREA